MKIVDSDLTGVKIIEPDVFPDERGFFQEVFRSDLNGRIGAARPFVQHNLSMSRRNVLRGMHYQLLNPQAKLVTVLQGEVCDVVVDIRRGSPTFGRHSAVTLSATNHLLLFVPEGFAHGFCVLGDEARFFYMTTSFYAPGDDHGILWSDPDLAIPWPTARPVVSRRDAALPRLRDVPPDKLPLL
jgi:dTDP-4-dehydrorhamnose 3,5-epimerase